MAFGGYTGSVTLTVIDNPSGTAPSSSLPFGTPANPTTISAKASYSLGGNAVGSINQVATNVLTIAAGGSSTINLQSLTNMLGTTGVSLVRLKRYAFGLLSTNDDTIAGTNCSGVTVGNAAINTNKLNLNANTATFTLTGVPTSTGDKQSYFSVAAAGIPVSATALNVLITNNDATNAAAVYYNLGGSDS